LYADEFKKLDEVIAKQGPFWGEDKIPMRPPFKDSNLASYLS